MFFFTVIINKACLAADSKSNLYKTHWEKTEKSSFFHVSSTKLHTITTLHKLAFYLPKMDKMTTTTSNKFHGSIK